MLRLRTNFPYRAPYICTMHKAILSVLFCLGYTVWLVAQVDTTLLLQPERLDERHIRSRHRVEHPQEALSATHYLEDVQRVPHTIWIMSRAEIQSYGLTTLAEVLRYAPGVRTSQPGSALEGDLFQMRGLSGNRYVKILINDIPIKPSVAPGLPLGANLPIRQAERIEVYYGAASTLYGDEACAGVVNIILRETERPVFAQANVSFGNLGYSNLDITCGGKLGRDEHVFRFSLYGSNTYRSSTPIYRDTATLYSAHNYPLLNLPSNFYTENANFQNRVTNPPLPHNSRLIGLNLSWRGWHLLAQQMARTDATVLGLNPTAIAYQLPADRLSDMVETYALRYQTRYAARWTWRHTLSLLRYQVENTSSGAFVFNNFGAALYRYQAQSVTSDSLLARIRRSIISNFVGGTRYGTAKGADVRWESLVQWNVRRGWSLQGGLQAHYQTGTPYQPYYGSPTSISVGGRDNPVPAAAPFSTPVYDDQSIWAFAQMDGTWKRFRLLAGAAMQTATSAFGPILVPKAALLYTLDSARALRVAASTGFRRPNAFTAAHTYLLSGNEVIPLAGYAIFPTERTTHYEVGYRSLRKHNRLEALGFFQQVNYLLHNGQFHTLSDGSSLYGFANAPALARQQWGGQIWWSTGTTKDFKINKEVQENVNIEGDVYLQYTDGVEWLPSGERIPYLREQPRWITQVRGFAKFKSVVLCLASIRQTGFTNKTNAWQTDWNRFVPTAQGKPFRTWDVMVRWYLSNNFLVYAQAINIFNRSFAGLDATGTTDDLLYNQQMGRQWRFGVHYSMD